MAIASAATVRNPGLYCVVRGANPDVTKSVEGGANADVEAVEVVDAPYIDWYSASFFSWAFSWLVVIF